MQNCLTAFQKSSVPLFFYDFGECFFLLPAVLSDLFRCSKTARGAFLFPSVKASVAASPASNYKFAFSSFSTKRSSALYHLKLLLCKLLYLLLSKQFLSSCLILHSHA